MDLKFFIGPAISFVLALIAFVPLVKYRLREIEEETDSQGEEIQKNKDDNHRLELLILQNDKDSNSKSMIKMAEALLLVAESNTKFQSIVEAQTELIKKAHDASTRAHERIDEQAMRTAKDLDDVKEKFVSHKYFDDVVRPLKEQFKNAP